MLTFNDSSTLLGAGSYGLVILDDKYATKLFYDMEASASLQKEASIQVRARQLLNGIVNVPDVHEISTIRGVYKQEKYLYGIKMDCVSLVDTFDTAVHMLLGYEGEDIDTVWGRDLGRPVSEDNPPRGFHASPEMMEAIWEDTGYLNISIESVASTMGLGLGTLIKGGIIPNDLEWIYGGDKSIHLIDFGLCKFGNVRDPIKFVHQKGSESLGGDFYIPTKGYRGHDEFMEGYLSALGLH